jgi:hypothetical protein
MATQKNETAGMNKADASARMEAFLLAKAIANAPAWMPADNPDMATFEGEVIGLRMGRDNGYGEYPVITYKLDDGTFLNVHAFHTLLRQQLAEAGTTVGKRQILSYDGKKRKNNATTEEIEKGLADYHLTFVMNVGEEIKAVDDNFTF